MLICKYFTLLAICGSLEIENKHHKQASAEPTESVAPWVKIKYKKGNTNRAHFCSMLSHESLVFICVNFT